MEPLFSDTEAAIGWSGRWDREVVMRVCVRERKRGGIAGIFLHTGPHIPRAVLHTLAAEAATTV